MAFSPYGRVLYSSEANLAGAGSATPSGIIDIRDVTDLWLAVYVVGTSTGTSPTLNVQLDVIDNFGNVFPAVLALSQITSAPGHAEASVGLHGYSTNQRTLPSKCQVTYTLGGTNPAYPQVCITLAGR